MKSYIDIPKPTISSVTCDACGRMTESSDVLEVQEYHEIHFTGGFSSVFGDEATVDADICQHCLKSLLGHVLRIK